MNKNTLTRSFLVSILFVFILAGCAASPTVVVQPTQDISVVRTEAARTVVAKMTIEAALNPTATEQPTWTPQAPVVITATPDANAVAQVSNPTATPASPSTNPTATPASPSTNPTATPDTPPNTPTVRPTLPPVSGGSVVTRTPRPNQALFISQTPLDGTKFSAGNSFDAAWTFKNTGTRTWTTGYEYRFASGDNLALSRIYALKEEVKPGETVTLIADMVAPPTAGRYISHWELVNTNGDVFARFYVVIDVTE